MKAIFVVAAAMALVSAVSATATEAQMYDQSYAGPRNYYGQPTFEMYQQQRQQAQGPQAMDNGLIFQAARGVYQVGNVLWGYMPAPVRGVQSPYDLAPDSGNVTIQLVPGAP